MSAVGFSPADQQNVEDRKKMNDLSQNQYIVFLFWVYLTKQENDEQQESRKL
jgi:hypothetical protein